MTTGRLCVAVVGWERHRVSPVSQQVLRLELLVTSHRPTVVRIACLKDRAASAFL